MIDVLQLIKDRLVSEGIPFPIKKGYLPDEPSQGVALYFLDGDSPTFYFGDPSAHIYKPRVRVTVRAESYPSAYAVAVQIKAALEGFTILPTFGVFLEGDLTPLGQDENKNTTFTLNYRTIINEE